MTWNWVPFWEEPPEGVDPRDPFYRTPEFRPPFARDYPDRVHNGEGSDRWFNYFAVNRAAGIMQYVANLTIGAPIRFTSWLQLWSSNDNAQPPRSTNDGDLKVRVCIDQDGGPRDMTDPNLICSPWAQPYDRWEQISVEGVAMNSVVNVLIWSRAEIPVEHNDVYADDSCFEILPAPGAKGICLGQGYVPTGPGVTPAPLNAATIQTSAADQAAKPPSPATRTQPLTKVTAPTGSQPALAVNARERINVREFPSEKAKVLTTARRGAVLTVLGKTADNQWFQVTAGGKQGWVAARLTLPNAAAKSVKVVMLEEQPPTTDNLR